MASCACRFGSKAVRMAAYARKFAALTAGGQRIVPFGDACNFCAGTRVWRGTCSTNGMKNRDQEGMRTGQADSIRDQEGGPGSAGQSGDTQGLSNVAEAGPLSGEERSEEETSELQSPRHL